MDILNIGSVAYDTIIQVHDFNEFSNDLHLWAKESYFALGSTGAGKALCLDALGIDNTLITMIGEDEIGKKIRQKLSNLDTEIHIIDTDKSIAHTNFMYGEGGRISATTSFPTSEEGIDHEKYEPLIKKVDIVLLNINNFARGFIPIIKKHKKLILVDLHDYDGKNKHHQEFIEAADILVTSGVNIDNTETYLNNHIKCGKLLSVVTLGSKGYIAIDKDQKTYRGQIFNGLAFVDSNGAGDSFSAGFAVEYTKTKDISKALEFANLCGAVSCSSKQLFHPDYTYEDVKKLNKKS